jgi:putative FmdB family regulatory protein
MPIYEYRCESCGHQQEFLQKVSDATLTVCTKCGKPTFTKMVTAAGFQLKGSGWYATDFKNSGAKPASKASSASSGSDRPATETKGDSQGDSKSDAKSDSKSDSKGESKSETAKATPAAAPAPPKPAA